MYSLGIDTGGTYTDAVAVDPNGEVIASAKALTRHHDLAIGIGEALDLVCTNIVAPISLVSLSTTLATNAIVEGRGAPAALVLIGGDSALIKRAGLHEALGAEPWLMLAGGHDASGNECRALDVAPLRPWLDGPARDACAFAVCAEFGSLQPEHELTVREAIRQHTDRPVTCAHELSSRLNAPRRALTALLNARLLPRITMLMQAVQSALHERSIHARLMVVKGDGSLIDVRVALERPVETILSGPAASIVGAAHVSRHRNMIVADIGGTTTDIAALVDGRPHLDANGARVGGHRTMVEAAAVHSFGLGGDSIVRLTKGGGFSVGANRIVPITRLALGNPQLRHDLDALCDEDSLDANHLRFVWRDPLAQTTPPRLRRDESALWHRLSHSPVVAASVATDSVLSAVLDRMIARGVVAVSGLTPTDAAHVVAMESTGDAHAAYSLVNAWFRYLQRLGIAHDASPKALAERVLDTLAHALALALMDGAYEAKPLAGVDELAWNASVALREHSLAGDSQALVTFTPRLTVPVVAVGASATTHFPRVQRRLSFDLETPCHGAVTNALGAVVGSVTQSVSVKITAPFTGVFRVHAGADTRDHTVVDAALAHARCHAATRAREDAARAGAHDAVISIDIERNEAALGSNERLFVEATVIATARGRASYTLGAA